MATQNITFSVETAGSVPWFEAGQHKDASYQAGRQKDTNCQVRIVQDDAVRRSASWADVAYHSVTGMVGAGVLGLPATFAHLGWAGGVIFLLASFWISWYTYKLLVYMHEVPDLNNKAGCGIRRLDRYDHLSRYILGKSATQPDVIKI
eukprot:GHRR01017950.1.p1 GENE.GHRR01017950.1~~GHRR01017950.1.p1  ORF type:complete len:148 (-),score=8.66 GHRR01017950.1:304-747(-)